MEDREVKINGSDTDELRAHMVNDEQRHAKQGLWMSALVADYI